MNYEQCHLVSSLIANRDYAQLRSTISDVVANGDSGKINSDAFHASKFIRFIDSEFSVPEFSIFAAKGNVKLPFIAFSVLPFITCPGMGSCSNFCYSPRAWRYPSAFFRQAQNTILMRDNQQAITASMQELLKKRKFAKQDRVDFRLYVDGDFDSDETLRFWMEDFLPAFPKLDAYGYSKSWELFVDFEKSGKAFPDNYLLNISSGSKYDDDEELKAAMLALPITRGEFIAVPIETDRHYSAPKGEYREKGYKTAVREAHGKKSFVCPGQCGSCTPKGHACGSEKFKGIQITIGIH